MVYLLYCLIPLPVYIILIAKHMNTWCAYAVSPVRFCVVCVLPQPPQLTHVEKDQMKEAMLQVMAVGTRDIAQEAQFIKIKVPCLALSCVVCTAT